MSIIGVKFADGGRVFSVETPIEVDLGDMVVVETLRGLELAKVCKPCGDTPSDEVKSVERRASEKDLKKMEELRTQVDDIKKLTNSLIEKYRLDMKLVDVNFTLDGTKVIINYVCEDRVDFRELVKELASNLRARIELRQIGIRDQAKILGGIGFCGKECCCKKYLNDFDKVSIKMAKTQGLSLNPTKISGICGRLMCCLAYENDTYADIAIKMPKLNSRVQTKDGTGSVVYNNILKQVVTVKVEKDGEIKVGEYPLGEIEIIAKPQENMPKKKDWSEQAKKQDVPQEKSAQTPNKEENKGKCQGGQTQNAEKQFGDKKKFNKFKKKKQNNGNK